MISSGVPHPQVEPRMRQRPYAFLRVGSRWINITMVTDIEDRGNELT